MIATSAAQANLTSKSKTPSKGVFPFTRAALEHFDFQTQTTQNQIQREHRDKHFNPARRRRTQNRRRTGNLRLWLRCQRKGNSASDLDLAVSGLPRPFFYRMGARVSDLIGHSVDLIDLDSNTPFTRYLRSENELVQEWVKFRKQQATERERCSVLFWHSRTAHQMPHHGPSEIELSALAACSIPSIPAWKIFLSAWRWSWTASQCRGDSWHRELLLRMKSPTAHRPALLSEELRHVG